MRWHDGWLLSVMLQNIFLHDPYKVHLYEPGNLRTTEVVCTCLDGHITFKKSVLTMQICFFFGGGGAK